MDAAGPAFINQLLGQLNLADVNSGEPLWKRYVKVTPALPFDQRVSYFYDRFLQSGMFPSVTVSDPKSVSEALKYQQLGNQEFFSKNYVGALEYYTMSLTVSPEGSKEIALAYANRSAALFRLERYDSCLVDINRALKNNYPESLKPKLFARKSKCLAKTEDRNDSMAQSSAKINSSKMPEEGAVAFENVDGTAASKEFDEESTDVNFDTRFPLPSVDFKNKIIPNASEKVKICYSKEMGRHLVATEDIETGEVLIIEKPYSFILDSKLNFTHCANCFIRTVSLIPCHTCSSIMFCGERCRKEALKSFHRVECKILPFILSSKIMKFDGMDLLALRTLLVASKQGEELRNLMEHPLYGRPFSKDNVNLKDKFMSEDYFNIHNLEDHSEQKSLVHSNLLAAKAAFLLHVLLSSSFFDKTDKKNPTDAKLSESESYVGTLLLKYLFVAHINCFEIGEMILKQFSPTKMMPEYISTGAAMCSLHSLLNHSCDPNIVGRWHKNYMVSRAIQPIAAGEQIFDNYGPRYIACNFFERQLRLKKQYFFECKCIPCKFKWPSMVIPTRKPKYLSEKVDKKELQRYSDKYNRIPKIPNNEHFDFLCKYVSLMHRSIERPWAEYIECQQFIRDLLSYQSNYYDVLDNDLIC